MQFYV